MKQRMVSIIAFCMSILLSGECIADTLYWWIKDDPNAPLTTYHSTDGSTMPLSELVPPGDDSYSVRIRATLYGKTDFLPIYDGAGGWVDGTDGVWFGHDTEPGGSGWFTSGTVASMLGEFDDAAAVFVMEIGEYLYDETTDEGGWVRTIALSDQKTRDELSRFIHAGGIAPPSDIWNPRDFYELGGVPEPSSAILALIGIALLSIRRKLHKE